MRLQDGSIAWFNDTGAAAVLVAAALMLLMGIAALVLDGGLGYDEQRSTQNAADHAALTAAWTQCAAGGDEAAAIAAGLASADQNGYDDDGLLNTVMISTPSSGVWEATIVSLVDTSFGATLGTDQLSVRSVAVADCSVISGLGGYALFASGTACGPFELSFTGSAGYFDGNIHSNGRLKLNGSAADPTVVTGDVTYVESYSQVGVVEDLITLNPKTATAVEIKEPPGGWVIDDYKPGGSVALAAAGAYTLVPSGTVYDGVTLPNGLYYSAGSFTLKNAVADSVTLVAEGQITFIGTNSINDDGDPDTTTDGPWDPTGLGVFSNHIDDGSPCNNTAINWSGSAHQWSGVQYAPFGKVDMSGATNSAFNGAIIAYTISLPGSGSSIVYDDTFTGVVITTLALTD